MLRPYRVRFRGEHVDGAVVVGDDGSCSHLACLHLANFLCLSRFSWRVRDLSPNIEVKLRTLTFRCGITIFFYVVRLFPSRAWIERLEIMCLGSASGR